MVFSRKIKCFVCVLLAALVFTAGVTAASPVATPLEQVVEDGQGLTAIPGQAVPLSVGKTVEGTDTENEFIITMQAQTEDRLEELLSYSSALVVLILDTSGSMNDGPIGEPSPIENLRIAASSFIRDFADLPCGSSGDVVREIAIVEFNTDARKLMDFTNTRNPAGVTSLVNTVQSLIANGGTFTQGGILVARNLIHKRVNNGTLLPEDTNIYVVLFSDGQPNFHNPSSEIIVNLTREFIEQNGGVGNVTTPETLAYTSEAMVSLRANTPPAYPLSVFGVALGADAVVENMEMLSDKIFSSANSNDLVNEFKKVIEEIVLYSATFWKITDVLAENIKYIGVENVTPKGSVNPITFDVGENSMIWSMKDTLEEGDPPGPYTYSASFRVRADNTASGFNNAALNRHYTNDYAVLQYSLRYNGTEASLNYIDFHENTGYPIPFPVIRTFQGSLIFKKIDGVTGKAIPGIRFTLTLEGDPDRGISPYQATQTSGPDGIVRFEGIPSGHTYTLREYLTDEQKETYSSISPVAVTVSYGVTSVGAPLRYMEDLGMYTLENQPFVFTTELAFDKVDEDGVKIVPKSPGEVAVFKLTNLKTGTVDANPLQNGGRYIFTDVGPGFYELEEVTPPAGYKISNRKYYFMVENDAANMRVLVFKWDTREEFPGAADFPDVASRAAWNAKGLPNFWTALPDPLQVVNEKIKPLATLEFIKTDEDTREAIADVWFDVYLNGGLFAAAASDSHGLVKFAGLIDGSYEMKERTIVPGYEANAHVYRFAVSGGVLTIDESSGWLHSGADLMIVNKPLGVGPVIPTETPPEETDEPTTEPPATITPEPTDTATPEPTDTATPEPTDTATPEPTPTPTPTPEGTGTPVPTDPDVTEPPVTETPDVPDSPPPTDDNEPTEDVPEEVIQLDDSGTPLGVWRDNGDGPVFNEIILGDDGLFVEIDQNGTPLGYWAQDDNGDWVFEGYVPLGSMPTTGELSVTLGLLMAGLALGAAGVLARRRARNTEA